MEPSNDDLEHLLSAGRLSGARRERIFDEVYARAVPRRPLWKKLAFATFAPAVAVLCVAVWVTHKRDGFRARGVASTGPSVELGCAEAPSAESTTRCPAGGTLVFRVTEGPQAGYLAAWAEDDDGHRVWYSPARGGQPVALAASSAPQLLPYGYHIGADQPAGSYTVHVRVLREPRDQQRVLDADGDAVLGDRTFPLEVTP